MMPASNNGLGMNLRFPDVCLTPAAPAPIPIPYPNMANNCQAVSFSPNVYTGFMPALNMASVTSMTNGDNAGVANPLFMQAGGQTMGNPIIFINCVPAKNLLVPTFGNAFNNPVGATLVPSITTTLYTDGATVRARGAQLDGDTYRVLRRVVDCNRVADGDVVEVREAAPGVVWLIVRRFVSDVARRVHNALRNLTVQAVVLDLRGNPGGDADACLELAEDLLPAGAIIATRVQAGDERVHRARGPQAYDWPLAVLVDDATASAAELLAGSLQANERAWVMGQPTAGKGSAQQIRMRSDGDGLGYQSVAEFLLPGGRRLHGVGVRPDMFVDREADLVAATLTRLDWSVAAVSD